MKRLLILLVLPVSTGFAMDPPDIEWIVLYGYDFYDVAETSTGNLILAGWRQLNYPRTIFLYSSDGDYIWESSVYPVNLESAAVIEAHDGGFVATGYGLEDTSSTQYSLSLYKVSTEGDALWSRLFVLPDGTRGWGNELVLLPDGGFAVCGRKDPLEGMDIAWILRTDSQGDTLWTREWGYTSWATAVDILYLDDGLTVFAQGNTPSTPGGPHLLRYDMDGNLLWETDFPDWPAYSAQAMCEASDGGLLLMDNYWPRIVHTSYTGEPDWWFWPPGGNQPYSSSVSTTMDGGILYSGDIRGGPDSRGVCGVIARFDSHGEDLWHDFIYDSSCKALTSAIQLSQGGYVATGHAWTSGSGNQGFLIKYAPELGIGEGSASFSLELSPNPCSSFLSVSFTLPGQGNASVRVYDLSGRLVSTVAQGEFPAGSSTVQWSVPGELSSGCYFVQYNSEFGSRTESVALIR